MLQAWGRAILDLPCLYSQKKNHKCILVFASTVSYKEGHCFFVLSYATFMFTLCSYLCFAAQMAFIYEKEEPSLPLKMSGHEISLSKGIYK